MSPVNRLQVMVTFLSLMLAPCIYGSDIVSDHSCASDVNGSQGSSFIVDPVLSFIKAFRLKGDNETLRNVIMERFSSADVEKAKKLLWEVCEGLLLGAGLEFHIRRDSDRRSQLSANLDDLLQAFHRLDSTDEIPLFYCEALHLLKLPPLSLDPIAEQVKLNSSVLKRLSSTI